MRVYILVIAMILHYARTQQTNWQLNTTPNLIFIKCVFVAIICIGNVISEYLPTRDILVSGWLYLHTWLVCLSLISFQFITLSNSISLPFYYFPVYHLILDEDISVVTSKERTKVYPYISLNKSLGIHHRKRGIDHVQRLFHAVGLHVAELFSGQSVLDIVPHYSVRFAARSKRELYDVTQYTCYTFLRRQ